MVVPINASSSIIKTQTHHNHFEPKPTDGHQMHHLDSGIAKSSRSYHRDLAKKRTLIFILGKNLVLQHYRKKVNQLSVN
jgi:hypothetical protein